MITYTLVYITQNDGSESKHVDCFERVDDGKIVDYVDVYGETIATYSPALIVTVQNRKAFATLEEAVKELL